MLWRRQHYRMNLSRGHLTCSPTLEIPKCLCQLQRFDHYSFLLFIISDLRVPCQWEVLPQRVSIEAIIRHDASQVWMTDKENAKQVVHLPLIPIGAVVQTRDARHWRCFTRIRFDPYPRIMPDAQEIINHFEALLSCRIVHCCDVCHHCVLGRGVIFEKGHHRDDTRRRDVDG